MKRLFIVMLLTSCCLAQAADDELSPIIARLGASSHRTRARAETHLMAQDRDALDILIPALENTEDPEIQMRLKKIIKHIKNDPSKTPSVYYELAIKERGKYETAAKEFLDKASVSTSNTKGTAGTGGSFAQSFIPKCKTITSIEICTYPLSGGFGWMKLDLCESKNGLPGAVIASSWVWIPKDHNFPHANYVFHNIPDQKVNPAGTYWLVYSDFPAPTSNTSMINYGLSFQTDDYPDGIHLRQGNNKQTNLEDVKFRIFSSTPAKHPGYRKPTERRLKSLPPKAQQHRPWNK